MTALECQWLAFPLDLAHCRCAFQQAACAGMRKVAGCTCTRRLDGGWNLAAVVRHPWKKQSRCASRFEPVCQLTLSRGNGPARERLQPSDAVIGVKEGSRRNRQGRISVGTTVGCMAWESNQNTPSTQRLLGRHQPYWREQKRCLNCVQGRLQGQAVALCLCDSGSTGGNATARVRNAADEGNGKGAYKGSFPSL